MKIIRNNIIHIKIQRKQQLLTALRYNFYYWNSPIVIRGYTPLRNKFNKEKFIKENYEVYSFFQSKHLNRDPIYLVCYLYDQPGKEHPLKKFKPLFLCGDSPHFDLTTIFYLPKRVPHSLKNFSLYNQTTIHIDNPKVHNWFYQITGRKRIVLLPESPESLKIADSGLETLMCSKSSSKIWRYAMHPK